MNMASKMKRTSIDLPKRIAWVHRENCKLFVKTGKYCLER